MTVTRVCSVPDCGKAGVLRKGFCEPHYDRWRRHGDPLGGKAFRGEPQKWLKAKVDYTGDDCIPWPFAKRDGGRGGVTWNGVQQWAHRVMCEMAHGAPPTPAHETAHSCGNGHLGCCNPRHLRWDTKAGNQRDRVVHGTHNRGEQSAQAVLTENAVREIRSARGIISQHQLAKTWGISRSAVWAIHSGRSWAWLE